MFSLVNVAVVAFRESGAEFYGPSFRAPAYPYDQAVGVLGGLALLTQVGTLPIPGAFGILLGGVAWYGLHGRPGPIAWGRSASLSGQRRRPPA